MTTINKYTAKAWATTTRTSQNKNKPNMYTSFLKRERQYDPCRAKEIKNPGTRMYRKSVGENKQEQAKTRTSLICIPRSLSVSNNMTRVGRKKLTIQEPACTVGRKKLTIQEPAFTAKAWARTNKQAKTRTSLICIPRSLLEA